MGWPNSSRWCRRWEITTKGRRAGRKVLVRADSASGTYEFAEWLHGRKLGYSVGFNLPDNAIKCLGRIRAHTWTSAYDDEERLPRDGAWITEAADVLEMSWWPKTCGPL
ncbi:transposase [Lentzea pudingi]|uniref:transposase n=1 Tax=Lentzea pudingi TaxID=1789439 RepID=UPI00166CFEBF|nr:transposase [Lentzea pudingi]